MLVWNVRGLRDSKVELHNLADYFNTFDLVLLTETAVESVPSRLLDGYSVAEIPAEREGRAGQGLLLAVRDSSQYHVEDHTSDSTALWIRLCPTATQDRVLVGVCYLPLDGSPQLRQHSFQHRLDALANAVLASPGMPVILAGDFNAHVGAALNSRGRMLLQMCAAASLQVCTGQIAGDQASPPTLAATRRSQPTRPDHILANAAAVSLLDSVVVSQHRRGSDHWPLEVHLKMELRCQPLQPCSGLPIPCRRWSPHARAAFCDALGSQAPPPGSAQQDVAQVISQLHSHVTSAAHAAGMPLRLPPRQRPGRACPHQPFFDAECRSLKRQVRAAAPDDRKQLERHYHSVVRRKKRAYKMTRLQQLVDSQCLQQRGFWVKLRHRPPLLPVTLQTVQSWEPFMTKVADARLPQALSMPDCAYPQHAAAQAAALNSAITSAEIVSQLPRLHNGRSAGHADLPAEFLRYARQPPQPQQPPPPTCWPPPWRTSSRR